MRKANLLNDYAFKYVFGAGTKEANAALKGLIQVFLEKEVSRVVIKNSELYKDQEKMKDAKLDLFVEFNDGQQIDLEMQVNATSDDLVARFEYYMSRLHSTQEIKGKMYCELKTTYVLAFLNVKLYPEREEYEHVFQNRDQFGRLMATEEDKQKFIFVEMPKVDQNKSVENMTDKEKVIYYFLNCQRGMDDCKIKEIVEQKGVVSMIEERVDKIEEERWEKINKIFDEIARNEREVRQKYLIKQEVERAKEEAKRQGVQEGIEQGIEQGISQGAKDKERDMYLTMFHNGMSIEQIAKFCDVQIATIRKIVDK